MKKEVSNWTKLKKDFVEFTGTMCIPTMIKAVTKEGGVSKINEGYYVILKVDKKTVSLYDKTEVLVFSITKKYITDFLEAEKFKGNCIKDMIYAYVSSNKDVLDDCRKHRIGVPENRSSEVWNKYIRINEEELWNRFINKIKAQKGA